VPAGRRRRRASQRTRRDGAGSVASAGAAFTGVSAAAAAPAWDSAGRGGLAVGAAGVSAAFVPVATAGAAGLRQKVRRARAARRRSVKRFNLKTAVGRARWCVWARVCREATTRPTGVGKEERQRQTRDQACQRVRSGVTQMVRPIEGGESSNHAEFHEVISGQLRFLGSRKAALGRGSIVIDPQRSAAFECIQYLVGVGCFSSSKVSDQ